MLSYSMKKIAFIIAIILVGIAFAIPNFINVNSLQSLPDLIPKNKVNLGLDLQGGSHMLLEIDKEAVIKNRLEELSDQVREVLRSENRRIGYRDRRVHKDFVSVTIRDSKDFAVAEKQLGTLSTLITTSVFTGQSGVDVIIENLGNGVFKLSLSETATSERLVSSVNQTIEILRRRLDALGTKEPSIQRQGNDRILVQVPGFDDRDALKEVLESQAVMTFHLVDRYLSADEIEKYKNSPGTSIYPDHKDVGTSYLVKKRSLITGENLVNAAASFDSQTNEPVVNFRLDTSGAKRFGKITAENVGIPFAIILDGKVISAPVIREPIPGGAGDISGNFTVAEANNLAILLRAGALPAPINILEERSVGPGLGADSIAAGKLASIIGLIGVVIFMIVSYGLFGLFATFALFINLFLLLGALSALQATLTLPGIAGIVLTIGMSVDANVLIFERIREEVYRGKSVIASIDNGFSKAFGTILDSNITTFLAAVVLFVLGSGPVRGFSVTLALGIITSVFTAYSVTRIMIIIWLRKTKPNKVPI